MTKIHASAIISASAKIHNSAEIGPFCIIGENVEIGAKTVLKSSVVVEKNTKIGEGNLIYPFTTIGVDSQDLKHKPSDETFVEIGDNNTIREHVTIHLGTKDGGGLTKIGDKNLLMVGTHIAHDCVVKNHAILANNATLAGHVEIDDYVVIGGLSAVHQFVRIGKSAMIGGMSGVETDILPFATAIGNRAKIAGVNLIGMKRRNLDRDEINQIRHFYKEIAEKSDLNFLEKVEKFYSEAQEKSASLKEIYNFIKSKTSRQYCQF